LRKKGITAWGKGEPRGLRKKGETLTSLHSGSSTTSRKGGGQPKAVGGKEKDSVELRIKGGEKGQFKKKEKVPSKKLASPGGGDEKTVWGRSPRD